MRVSISFLGFSAVPEDIGSHWKSSSVTFQSEAEASQTELGKRHLVLGGEAGVLHPLVLSKIRLSRTCQNPQGCNLSQNLEQMAEGKAILAVS